MLCNLQIFNSFTSYFFTLYPTYIHILLIHCILLSKKIIPKTKSQDVKNASQFLNKTFACGGLKSLLRLTYILQSEFQMIIWMLFCVIKKFFKSNIDQFQIKILKSWIGLVFSYQISVELQFPSYTLLKSCDKLLQIEITFFASFIEWDLTKLKQKLSCCKLIIL